ncbi:UDP-N-acetylmuramate--L-alanine ligase [bacterium]
MFESIKHIHFIGIGGSGMSGIAELLLNRGYIISGSDLKHSEVTQRLINMGAKVYIGHRAKNTKGADVVVKSTAVNKTNIEVLTALKKRTPVIPRAEMLAELMRLHYSILVAGTHGKTTTTSMISWIMSKCGMDPTVAIGGCLNNFGTGAKLGQGKFMIAEADESDGSFLKLTPTVAVITNIDNDHMDYYKSFNNLFNSFMQFVNKLPFYGWLIANNDDKHVRKIMAGVNRKVYTYGIKNESNLTAYDICIEKSMTAFNVHYNNKKLGRLRTRLHGEHNVLNSLGAILTCLELGISFKQIVEAFSEFQGVGRRLEIKGQKKDVIVIDDYGHHPNEISATWESVKNVWNNRKKYIVFQPHRYSRTQLLAKEFAKELSKMENVILLPIYPAGEKPINGISSKTILRHIPKTKRNKILYINNQEQVVPYLLDNINTQSLVLTLGAGNVFKIGEELLKRL